jgi:hypothetical protein
VVVEPLVLRLTADNRRRDDVNRRAGHGAPSRCRVSGWFDAAPRSRSYPTSGRPPHHTTGSDWPPWPSSSTASASHPHCDLTLPQPTATSSIEEQLRRTIERPNGRASFAARRAELSLVIQACGSPAPGHFMPLSGDRIRTRPLNYEPTSRRLKMPRESQTRRSRLIGHSKPSRRVSPHHGLVPRFVHESVHHIRPTSVPTP